MSRLGAILGSLVALNDQRGALVPWIPVLLACGIGVYFSLPVEPGQGHWIAHGCGLAVLITAVALGGARQPVLVAMMLVGAGFAIAGLRTNLVAGPVLEWRYYGPVEGRVVTVDRSGSDKPRLTLDRVVLDRVAPDRTPHRVRVSLHGAQDWLTPEPGQRILVTAHLSAPQGPVEPGAFDFQRMAWFGSLGAVGCARTPALLWERDAASRPLGRLRQRLSLYVQSVLPGEAGAFAAAITTGDRSAMGADTLGALRASNLAHLLAISGLHMGLLTGVAFAAFRFAFALVPGWPLTRPIKKYAALGALAAGAFYLALSGGNIATQRAFIMAAVMLIAVCLDRRAVTLRAVAVAATIVLLLRPEALSQPGFQMSFAATTALVAVFRLLRDHVPAPGRKWLRPVIAVFVSSGIAGLATAPYGAAHFNQLSHYGLLANVVSVPLMGLVVMPAAVLAAVLTPLGLGWIGLWIMQPAIQWIMLVAHQVSEWPHAVSRVMSPPSGVLPLLSIGMIFLILWQGRLRWAGLAPAVVAALLWGQAQRPDILIAPSGGLVGILEDGQRVLSKPKGDGFAARVWLENDGDWPDQVAASRDFGKTGEAYFDLGGLDIVQISGRGAAARGQAACAIRDIVVITKPWEGPSGPCLRIDGAMMMRTGAIAIDLSPGGARVSAARHVTGKRPWNHGGEWLDVLPKVPASKAQLHTRRNDQ